MRVLIVHAHPDPSSFNAALCQTAAVTLTRVGHAVTVIDLYADGFAAAMTRDERLAYEGPDPILDPQVRRYADLVRTHEALVFVYPTWWWGLPAILKGFLERVLVPGVSFHLDPATNRVTRGLGHVQRVAGVTTYGSSRASMRLFNDSGRRHLLRCVRMLAPTRTCRSTWLGLYGMDRAGQAQRTAFARRVEDVLGRW